MTRIQDIAAFNEVREAGLAKLLPSKPRIGVGMGTCGSGNGAEAVFQAFASEIDARGLAVQLAPVGCFGFCAEEPLVNVWVPGRPLLILHRVQPNHVDPILGGPRPGQDPAARARPLQDRGVGPPHRPREVRLRATPSCRTGTRSRSSRAR